MADKAAAPDHRAWEFAPDPFAARKEVEGRQEKRRVVEAQKAEIAASGGGSGSGGASKGKGREGGAAGGWEKAPEVRMATGLREMVEATVRKVRLPSFGGITVLKRLDDAEIPDGGASGHKRVGGYPFDSTLGSFDSRTGYYDADDSTHHSRVQTFSYCLISQRFERSPCPVAL